MTMRKALRFCAVIRIFIIAGALSTWSLCGASASDVHAEIVATDLRFPEGTIFVGNGLYFVDYARSSVLRLVGGKTETVWHQDGCGANGLVAVPGGLLAACSDSGTIVRISSAGETLTTIRADDSGQALVAPNDLAADQKGGVYVSDSGSSSRPGKVFYLSRDRMLHEVANGFRFANGVGPTARCSDKISAIFAKPDVLPIAVKQLPSLVNLMPALRAWQATYSIATTIWWLEK